MRGAARAQARLYPWRVMSFECDSPCSKGVRTSCCEDVTARPSLLPCLLIHSSLNIRPLHSSIACGACLVHARHCCLSSPPKCVLCPREALPSLCHSSGTIQTRGPQLTDFFACGLVVSGSGLRLSGNFDARVPLVQQ